MFLTDDVLGIQETRGGRAGPVSCCWSAWAECWRRAGGYDAQKRLHLLNVEVDCWLKGSFAITWSRRSVLFAAPPAATRSRCGWTAIAQLDAEAAS